MNIRSRLIPQFAFWGICLIGLAWITLSFWFEIHLGLPATSVQWVKRAVGWVVEIWLIRTLLLGARRCGSASWN